MRRKRYETDPATGKNRYPQMGDAFAARQRFFTPQENQSPPKGESEGKKMTLAEWKRRMVKGARLLHVSNARGPVNEIYTVSIVQTNGVFMTPDKERPDKKDLWMTFPKAKGLTADNNGFTLTYEGGATSVYQWVKP